MVTLLETTHYKFNSCCLSISFLRLKYLESNWTVHCLTYLLSNENDPTGTQSWLKWRGKKGEERGGNTEQRPVLTYLNHTAKKKRCHSKQWWQEGLLSLFSSFHPWEPISATPVLSLYSNCFPKCLAIFFFFSLILYNWQLKQMESSFKTKTLKKIHQYTDSMLAFLFSFCFYASESKKPLLCISTINNCSSDHEFVINCEDNIKGWYWENVPINWAQFLMGGLNLSIRNTKK